MIKIIKQIWKRIPHNFKNRAIVLWKCLNRSGFVAHHGLERSGTNYISRCLQKLSLTPVNKYNSAPNHPTHKHFRWQPDKGTIMFWCPPNIPRYNELRASNIYELNILAGYPKQTRHIVIKKELNNWLLSILNFGLGTKFFLTREDVLDALDILKADYKAYYDFWQSMERDFPNFVTVVNYENISTNPSLMILAINKLGLIPKNKNSFTGRFEEVNMSPLKRKSYLIMEDIYPYLESD